MATSRKPADQDCRFCRGRGWVDVGTPPDVRTEDCGCTVKEAFDVTDLATGSSCGSFESLEEAQGCVEFDGLLHWEIRDVDGGVVDHSGPRASRRAS